MKYEVIGLSPDNEVGYQSLHEYLQDGWEVCCVYQEPEKYIFTAGGYVMWINHILLRRAVSENEQLPEKE